MQLFYCKIHKFMFLFVFCSMFKSFFVSFTEIYFIQSILTNFMISNVQICQNYVLSNKNLETLQNQQLNQTDFFMDVSTYNKHIFLEIKQIINTIWLSQFFTDAIQQFLNFIQYIDLKLLCTFQILPVANAINIGQIGYFEGPCPDGWSDYLQVQGKFILAAGNGYNINQTGGEKQHVLTLDQMPSHDHSNGQWNQLLRSTCHYTPEGDDYTCGQPDVIFPNKILMQGNNKPHNNMPPYITLRACKKIREDDFTVQITNLQTLFDNLKANMTNQITNLTYELVSLNSKTETEKANKTAEIVSLKSVIQSTNKMLMTEDSNIKSTLQTLSRNTITDVNNINSKIEWQRIQDKSISLGLGITAIIVSLIMPVIQLIKHFCPDQIKRLKNRLSRVAPDNTHLSSKTNLQHSSNSRN